MSFSIEEENLIHMFHKGDRKLLINTLQDILPHLTNEDMKRLVSTTLSKVERLSDQEYQGLTVTFTE